MVKFRPSRTSITRNGQTDIYTDIQTDIHFSEMRVKTPFECYKSHIIRLKKQWHCGNNVTAGDGRNTNLRSNQVAAAGIMKRLSYERGIVEQAGEA